MLSVCLAVLCIALSLGTLAFLVRIAYSRRRFYLYAAAKAAASAAFLVTAAAGLAVGGAAAGPVWLLLAGLALCFAGDVLLGLANVHADYFGRFFAAGAAAFCAAHLVFCTLFARLQPLSPLHMVLPAVLVMALVPCARDTRRFRLRRMKYPALVYTFCVGLMCALSVSLGLRAPGPAGALAAAGGVLFLVSDATLLFLYFYHKKRALLRAANLVSYYLGMLCLAFLTWTGLPG